MIASIFYKVNPTGGLPKNVQKPPKYSNRKIDVRIDE